VTILQSDAVLGRVTVSAAMIVRDEEKFLPGCLALLAGSVNEIVIVDTGSRDRTVDIANDFGARVLHHNWNGDFAAARNVALDAATCDWILYIDADERLSLPRGGCVGDYIDPLTVAALVRFRPKTGYTRYREWRLFRNDPRIRFEGRIHESMVRGIQTVAASDNLSIVHADVAIDHLGYDGDQSHKHPRNLPLLEACVRDHPGRVYYWYHLAETLAALGREAEAISIAEAGLVQAARELSDKQRSDASLLTQTLVRLRLARKQTTLGLIDAGLARVPEDFALHFLRARALLDEDRAQEALEIAETLLSIDPDALCDGLLAFDQSIFRERACELGAVAALRLGRKADAGAYFRKASQFAPHDRSYAIRAVALGARVSA
jgi:tetratricopeptide (TPR) repeat protein